MQIIQKHHKSHAHFTAIVVFKFEDINLSCFNVNDILRRSALKISIMQPYLFPYLGYFQLINYSDAFVIFDDVNYIKKGFINRNNYLIGGSKKLVTVPVLKASQNKKINELFFSNEVEGFLKNISFNYKGCKYYDDIYPLVEKALSVNDKSITNVCRLSIELILNYLGIDKKIILSSSIDYDRDGDAVSKVLSICDALNSSDYINPVGGIGLYDKDVFAKENIRLSFLKTKFKSYEQGLIEFVPALSIVDILMRCDKDWVLNSLNDFELV